MKNKYIQRRLLKTTPDDLGLKQDRSPRYEEIYLDQLIKDENKRIVLLGESGSGKSTELRHWFQVFHAERNINYVPILIPLNTYTGNDFSNYVSMKIGESASQLLGYNKDKIVFFLDEFDQVLNKESGTRQIQTFIDLYRESMFIISCRSNFYTNQFPEFDIYYLSPFTEDDIAELSETELPTSHKQFIAQLNTVKIKEIAQIPFFLRYLIDLFQENDSIPYSQTEVLEMVINDTLRDVNKKLSDYDLPNKYPLDSIRNDLTLISLIMEIQQKNYIDASELNSIIKYDLQRDVIKNVRLIKDIKIHGKEAFQFVHNNFNEYLAAKSLCEEDFEKIIDFLSIKAPVIKLNEKNKLFKLLKYFNIEVYGLKVLDLLFDIIGKKKRIGINPSWVNTLGFLSQLRNNRDLIRYLVNHEPEIALRIELSRLTEDNRYTIFESLLNDYRDKKITIQSDIFLKLVDIISISDERKHDIYSYLMRYAAKGEHHNHRYNALHLLCYVKGDYSIQIIKTITDRINDPSEVDTVKHICMISLVELGATGKDIVDQIIKVFDSDSAYTLSGLYYLLSHSPDVDRYVDILVAGIPKSKTHSPHEIRLADERYYLLKCLEKVSSPTALNTIIDFLATTTNAFHDYDLKELIPFLIQNLTKAYATNNTVYEYAKKLLLSAEKSHSDQLSEIGHFFINTNTALRIFKNLISQGVDKHYETLAVIINNDTLELLVDEYMKGNISEDNVWIFIRYISFRNQEKYQEALKFINSKTNDKFVQESPIDYTALNKSKLLRKVEIIFNKTEFIKELKDIFKTSKKVTIKYQDTIDLEHENLSNVHPLYNAFVIDEIQKILIKDQEKEWSLEALIEIIDTYNYDIFTFEHIFKLLYDGAQLELDESQVNFIKNYCETKLNKVDFRTALSVTRNEDGNLTTSADGMAVRIWFCKRKFNLALPESTMLDMLSFDWIEQLGYCGINYLLDELDTKKVSERIKQNLKVGIKIAAVLINHVDYCLKNNLDNVLEYIYASMNGEFIDNHDKKKIMKLLNKFHDGRQYIKRYLKSDDKELYLEAAELLGDSEDVKEIIRGRLNDSNIDIAIESAKLLIPDQNMDAIKLYVNYVIENKKFKEEIHSPIGRIDTIEALDCLGKLLLFYFENHKEIEENYSFLHMEILQALKNIARKNYQNLRKVDHLLEKFINTHEKKWGFVVHLNRYRKEIEDEYYANYKEVNNLQEALQKARTIFPNLK